MRLPFIVFSVQKEFGKALSTLLNKKCNLPSIPDHSKNLTQQVKDFLKRASTIRKIENVSDIFLDMNGCLGKCLFLDLFLREPMCGPTVSYHFTDFIYIKSSHG